MIRASLLAAWLLLLPAGAQALVFSDLGSGQDPIPSGWSHLDFTAEGRIGNAATSPGSAWSGTHEMDVGRNTSGQMSVGNFKWLNHATYAFELAFDGTAASWTMDKGGADERRIEYSTYGSLAGFDGLLFRLRANPGGGDQLTLSDLSLNSTAVGALPFTWGPGASDASNYWLGLSGAGNLAAGFSLAGKIRFDWAADAALPSNSQLAFQVKGADAEDVPVVPEPGTMALLATGLAAAGLARRRSRRVPAETPDSAPN